MVTTVHLTECDSFGGSRLAYISRLTKLALTTEARAQKDLKKVNISSLKPVTSEASR